MNPFVTKEKIAPSFIETIFKIDPKFNAVIEINNLLATKQLSEIDSNEVEKIAKKYKVNIRKSYRSHFKSFYSVYLKYCFDDRKLSGHEAEELDHLKKILCLTEKELASINAIIRENIYIEETKKALTDGRLTEEERIFLENLKKELAVTEATAEKIYAELAQDYYKNYFGKVIADNRISLEEERELQEIADSLGLDVTLDEKAKYTFDKLKLLWLIENNLAPPIYVDMPLLEGENCYLKTPCLLMEESIKSKDKDPTTLIEKYKSGRIIKYNSSSIKPEDTLRFIDKGTLYLTDQRIIFTSTRARNEILIAEIAEIADLKSYINGIELRKTGGVNVELFFNFQEHVEVFISLMNFLVQIKAKNG